jgi:hypothetical protein
MTYKEKIIWLSRYKDKDKEIDRLLDERAGWWSKATKITPTLSDMPKAASEENKIQTAIEKMEEIDDQINSDIDDMQDIKVEIMGAIKSLDDNNLRILLEYWYINHMRPIDIARRLHYSPDGKNVFKMHKKAIQLVKVDTPLHSIS